LSGKPKYLNLVAVAPTAYTSLLGNLFFIISLSASELASASGSGPI